MNGAGEAASPKPYNAAMSNSSQWIAGINAVASALEHDAGNVREVLVEAGGRNARLAEIESQARRFGIDVRRVAQQALDGVAGGLRHRGRRGRDLNGPRQPDRSPKVTGTRWPSGAEGGADLQFVGVLGGPAESNPERPGERRLGDTGVRARMAGGIAAPRPDRADG